MISSMESKSELSHSSREIAGRGLWCDFLTGCLPFWAQLEDLIAFFYPHASSGSVRLWCFDRLCSLKEFKSSVDVRNKKSGFASLYRSPSGQRIIGTCINKALVLYRRFAVHIRLSQVFANSQPVARRYLWCYV